MALSPIVGGATSVGTGGAFVDDSSGITLPAASDVRFGVDRGDGVLGTLVVGVTQGGSARGLFNKRCTIQRYTEGAKDTYGHATKTWADLSTDVPCRRNAKGGRENWPSEDKKAVAADSVFYMPAGQDITERDTIILESVTYEILLVEPFDAKSRQHHKRCFVRTVR